MLIYKALTYYPIKVWISKEYERIQIKAHKE
jgi:hypothetical protein